jgi:hypothetical protein
MKFCKHVLNLLRYYKISFDYYTYTRKNRDIPLEPQFPLFWRSNKTSSSNFECKFLRVQKELTVEIWWDSSYTRWLHNSTYKICKKSFDLLQFPNFITYPMLWQFWKEKKTNKQTTLEINILLYTMKLSYNLFVLYLFCLVT